MSAALDAAHEYAELGWPVIPLHHPTSFGPKKGDGHALCSCGKSTCEGQGKHGRTRHGYKDGSTDHDTIAGWWGKWPKANVGIVTGEVLDVLDLDSPEALDLLPEKPDGPTVHTGRGMHVYYRPAKIGTKVGILSKIDWKGEGGHVVGPGSRHYSGATYEWDAKFGMDWPLSPAPSWLPGALQAPEGRQEVPGGVAQGLTTSYGRKALEGEVFKVVTAPEGSRHPTLIRSAYVLGQLIPEQLDYATVVASLYAASSLPLEERKRTIEDGLRKGMENPRGPVVSTAAPATVAAAPAWGGDLKVNVLLNRPGLIHGFEREMSDPPGFVVKGAKGTGRLTSLQVSKAENLRAAILDATGELVVAPPSGISWVAVSGALMEDVWEVSLGEGATLKGEGEEWLRTYSEGHCTVEDPADAVGIFEGVVYHDPNGQRWVYGPALKFWLLRHRQERLTGPMFGRTMTAAGAKSAPIKLTIGDQLTTRSFWSIPSSLY